MAKWILEKQEANIELMADTLSISKVLAQVMVNRHIRTKNTALRFLHPDLSFLHDSFGMKDMEKAIHIIVKSVSLGEKVVIYGDYDVDGVTSSVILYKTLKNYGADVSFYIPHREEEGYGLSIGSVRKLHDLGAELIVTCDNGIASCAEIDEANALGMKVIVIDHHEPGFLISEDGTKTDIIPNAAAVIDPKQEACPYPFKMLCAAGLAYKFSKAFHTFMEIDFDQEEEFLVFAMIATFCDIVDLQDENRVIAKHGLELLNRNKQINKGLYALMKEKGYDEKEITEFSIGFILGPCINATGRLEKATLAVELFTSSDETLINDYAKKLVQLNETRKTMTQEAFEKTLLQVESSHIKNDSVMVVFDPDTHESIAGIVAGRIKEFYHKPTIMLTKSGDFVKGSARSIEGYNIFEAMYACKDLFLRFGGHAMAAGVSLEEENLPLLRQRLNETCQLTEDDFVEIIKIDEELDLEDVTYRLAEELTKLAPCGKANKEPLFVSRGLVLDQLRVIEEKNTIIFTFKIGDTFRKIKALCFGQVEKLKEQLSNLYDSYDKEKILCGILRNANFHMDIVYALEINEYNGNVSVQMRIKDFILT